MVVASISLCAALLTSVSVAARISGAAQGVLSEVTMTKLTNNIRFADGLVNLRFAAKPAPAEKLIIFIPGGPGISGKYMDAFAQFVGRATTTKIAVVDLPNHDGSRVSGKTENLKYPDVRKLLLRTLDELSDSHRRELVLVGHSLGASIAMDLAGHSSAKISRVILVDIPTTFENSPEFVDGMRRVGASDEVAWSTEAAFSVWWNKIIPLYFSRQSPTAQEVGMLNGETFWIGSEHFTDDLPSFDELAARLRAKHRPSDIIYMEGEHDMLLPVGNRNKVTSVLAGVSVVGFANTGHFPMFESPDELVKQVSDFITAGR